MSVSDHLRPLARAALADMEREGHQGWRTPDDDLSVIAGLVAARRPMTLLELGTCTGYSTIVLADILAPYGGRVTTVEPDGNLQTVARHYAGRAGLENISFVEGKSTDDELLHVFSGTEWGMIYIDTTHQYAQTVEELRHYASLASGSTTIMLHDASVAAADELDYDQRGGVNRALREFLAEHADWQGMVFEQPAFPGRYGVGVMGRTVAR